MLRRGEDTFCNEHLAVSDAVVEIDAQCGDSGPAGSRAPNKAGAVPAEMPRPLLAARVEEGDDLVRGAVNSGYIRSFVVVARKTGEAKILWLRGAAVAFGDNVVDLKRRIIGLLGHAAIFTAVGGMLPYQFFQRAFHAGFSGAEASGACCRDVSGIGGLWT
jgi:hypothetical protein